MRQHRLLAGVLIIVSACFVLFATWHFFTGPRLLQIANPVQLKLDCALMRSKFPVEPGRNFAEIPKQHWPVSVQSLEPFRVTESQYAVHLWFKELKDGAYIGYYVHFDSEEMKKNINVNYADPFVLKPTKYDGISAFYLPGTRY